MNPDFLSALNEAYDRVKGQYAAQFPSIVLIDTSRGTTPQSTAAGVTETVLELLDRQLRDSRA
jgi:hypothetical protein